ncbi:MAG TPA: diguanylate cyclase [Thermoleophilaceae bacterium]|nr:diguanylate cyclase [Thermoleophilaceae bacterium]
MSFRGRLRLFFAVVVIVPMVALGIVLFALTARSERAKTDAGIAAATRTAVGVYREQQDRAQRELDRIARDEQLQRYVALGRIPAAAGRLRELVGDGVVAVELWNGRDEQVAAAGSTSAVAAAGTKLAGPRGRSMVLTVSATDARRLVSRVAALSGLDFAVWRGGTSLASTLPSLSRADFPDGVTPADFHLGDYAYRGKSVAIDSPAGPGVRLGIFTSSASLAEHIGANRLLIATLLVLFVLFALVGASFVSRSLTGQIAKLLAAARRLSRGDFRQPVPVEGNDEFAQLSREFNDMSEQLEAKIEEVENKRQELAETIRRVGDALATGPDRRGVVALAVRQAVDACDAEVGRALPLAHGAFEGCEVGSVAGGFKVAIEAAERDVFAIRADVGPELLGALEGEEGQERTRRAVSAQVRDVHAISIGLRSLVDGPEYLGAVSIARHGLPFSDEEQDLLEYLAGQAVVSIENASLHEAIERQATTDELTGLANVRAFLSILGRELERSRRFDSPLALLMIDIDDFKLVNDTYGHQQGDQVLAQVAGVLRDLSRDLDAPARYGGEEMAVILPQTDADGAARLAERMRAGIEALQVPRTGTSGHLSVTASFGVASVPESATDGSDLIAAADEALYRAKRGGKNRVERALADVAESFPRPR